MPLVRPWDAPDLARREEIVRGLIARGDFVAISGMPGTGKSLLAVDLSYSVATGNSFLGMETVQGEVLFLTLEKARETNRRFCAICDQSEPIFVRRDPLHFRDDRTAQTLIREAETASLSPALIVIDTYARCMVGLSENDPKDTGTAVEQLRKLQEAFPSAAIVIIHHVAQSSKDLRGSTGLLGAIDLELFVSTTAKTGRSIKVRKANGIKEGTVFAFDIETVDMLDGPVIVASWKGKKAPSVVTAAKAMVVEDAQDAVEIESETELTRGERRLFDALPDSCTRDKATEIAVDLGLITSKKPGEATRRPLKALEDAGLIKREDGMVFKLAPIATADPIAPHCSPHSTLISGVTSPPPDTPTTTPLFIGGVGAMGAEKKSPIVQQISVGDTSVQRRAAL